MSSQPISGYRQLAAGEIQLVNQNKKLEELILRQIDKTRRTEGFDPRWAALAMTHIQQGFMALNRAVMQPQRLAGPIDAEELAKEISK